MSQTPVRSHAPTSSTTAGPNTLRAVETRCHQFYSELDAIASRRGVDSECRDSILDCVIRHGRFLGGAWVLAQDNEAKHFEKRLNTPIVERQEIQKWMNECVLRSRRDSRSRVHESLLVRNLVVFTIPAPVRSSNPSKGVPQDWTLVLFASEHTKRSRLEDLFAVHAGVRAWSQWQILEYGRQSDERLLSTSALLELTTHVATHNLSFDAACQYTAAALQRYTQCRFAAIGLVSPSRKSLRLRTIAGIGVMDRRSAQVQHIETALNETHLRDRRTAYPTSDRSEAWQSLGHKRLAESIGAEGVVSVPLKSSGGERVGALLFAGQAKSLLSNQSVRVLESFAEPIADALQAVQRREGGLLSRLLRRGREKLRGSRKVVLGVASAVSLVLLCWPMPYRIHCSGRVEPVLKRYSLVPFDGLLESTLVRPGEFVNEGQVIARMDGKEIHWELAGLKAESERTLRELDTQMATQDISNAILAELESRKIAHRTDLLQFRREHLEIKSPLTGIVLSGSLDNRQNEPVKLGQTLYEVAPIERLRLEIEVPAVELSHIAVGQQVDARISGVVDIRLSGTITRIRPQSETRHQQNVFIAELEFDNQETRFRPGMEGNIRIHAGKHPLIWNVGHRTWDRVIARLGW